MFLYIYFSSLAIAIIAIDVIFMFMAHYGKHDIDEKLTDFRDGYA